MNCKIIFTKHFRFIEQIDLGGNFKRLFYQLI